MMRFQTVMALLILFSITDHAEDGAPGYCTSEKWENTINQEIDFQTNYPDLIVFPGFEYTRVTLPTQNDAGNGHKNIVCYDFDHIPPRGYGYDTFWSPTQLWNYLDETAASNFYISIPHHPAKGGDIDYPAIDVSTDWTTNYVCEEQMLVEIYSKHGNSENNGCEEPVNLFKPAGAVNSALDRWLLPGHKPEYKLGIIGSTDTHNGHPGDVAEITNNVQERLGPYTGGLAAVLVTNKNRENIWAAFKNKSCYGSSGARISLEFTAKFADEFVPMGSTIFHLAEINSTNVQNVNLHVRAESESTSEHTGSSGFISRLQIFQNSLCIFDMTNSIQTNVFHVDYTVSLSNNYSYFRAKIWQDAVTLNTNCQFERVWSSPIWIEKTYIPEPFLFINCCLLFIVCFRRKKLI